MKLYSLLHNLFHCISCKTLPEELDPLCHYAYEENEEIKQRPCQFFMVR